MLITCNQSCRAVLILLTAAPGPPQTCPRRAGEGGELQKKGSAFLLGCGRVCAFLSSCMEIIPIGADCFLGEREGAGGGVSGGRGSQGQEHPYGVQQERVPVSALRLLAKAVGCILLVG